MNSVMYLSYIDSRILVTIFGLVWYYIFTVNNFRQRQLVIFTKCLFIILPIPAFLAKNRPDIEVQTIFVNFGEARRNRTNQLTRPHLASPTIARSPGWFLGTPGLGQLLGLMWMCPNGAHERCMNHCKVVSLNAWLAWLHLYWSPRFSKL